MIIVKYIKLNMSFCLVMTVNFVTVLAAWNNSLQKGYMGVSKCCLLDCNFLVYVTRLNEFPCFCPIFFHVMDPNLRKSGATVCSIFAVTVEISIICMCFLFMNYDEYCCAAKKEKVE